MLLPLYSALVRQLCRAVSSPGSSEQEIHEHTAESPERGHKDFGEVEASDT